MLAVKTKTKKCFTHNTRAESLKLSLPGLKVRVDSRLVGLSRSRNKVTSGSTEKKMSRSEGRWKGGSRVGTQHRPLTYKKCQNFILLVYYLNQLTFHLGQYFVNITSICLPSTWSCSLAVRTIFSLFLYAVNCFWVLVNCDDNCSKCSTIPGFTWVSVT